MIGRISASVINNTNVRSCNHILTQTVFIYLTHCESTLMITVTVRFSSFRIMKFFCVESTTTFSYYLWSLRRIFLTRLWTAIFYFTQRMFVNNRSHLPIKDMTAQFPLQPLETSANALSITSFFIKKRVCKLDCPIFQVFFHTFSVIISPLFLSATTKEVIII